MIFQSFPLIQYFNLKASVALIQKDLERLQKTIERFIARAVEIREQEQGEPFGSPLIPRISRITR